MEQFSYSFAVSMMHSIWQMAVLLLFYYLLTGMFTKTHPVVKRNMMYGMLVIQLLTSVVTFLFYFSDPFPVLRSELSAVFNGSLDNPSFFKTYADYILYIYLVAVVYKTTALFYQWISFKKYYRRELIRPDVDLKVFTQLKAAQFGIQRKVQLWYSHAVTTPMTFGFLKPVILMPVALVNRLSTEEAEALILHELTHIRNHDFMLNWLLLTSETVYFFNPLVRIITRQIKLEREKNCDTQVLQFNYCRISYAEALLKTARQSRGFSGFQMAAVKKHSQLIQRIQFFTNSSNQAFRKRSYCGFSVLAMCTVLLLNLYIISQVRQAGNSSTEVPAFSIITPSIGGTMDMGASADERALPVVLNNMAVASNKARQESNRSAIKVSAALAPADINDASAFHNPYAIAASLKAEEPVVSKELIINDETSDGRKITRAYKVTLKDGEWIKEPLWMTTELRPLADSLVLLQGKLDSLQVIVDSIQ